MGRTHENISISIPINLKQRMDRIEGINWSASLTTSIKDLLDDIENDPQKYKSLGVRKR
jgi:hypothetical protein